jgi:hypothetical protein
MTEDDERDGDGDHDGRDQLHRWVIAGADIAP